MRRVMRRASGLYDAALLRPVRPQMPPCLPLQNRLLAITQALKSDESVRVELAFQRRQARVGARSEASWHRSCRAMAAPVNLMMPVRAIKAEGHQPFSPAETAVACAQA
jgi:hypothetical protein